jgi:hypothetical protein
VGDVLDVKLIEINERGQLRLSHRAVLLENEKGTSPKPGAPASSPGPSEPVRAAVRPVPKGVWQRPGPSTGAGNGSGGAQVREQGCAAVCLCNVWEEREEKMMQKKVSQKSKSGAAFLSIGAV